MAVKRLRWSRVQLGNFPDGRAALAVQFLDEEGNRCDWTPHWKNVEELFLKACNVESANKPDSAWIEDFAKTSNQVFSQFAGLIQDAKIVEGKLSEIRGGKLVLLRERPSLLDPILDALYSPPKRQSSARAGRVRVVEPMEISPSFELDEEFVRSWLGAEVRCFVINGFAVRLRNGYGDYHPRIANELGKFRF